MPNTETARQSVPDKVTNLLPVAEQAPLRKARVEFLSKVMQLVPTEPHEDLKSICQAWLEATQAKWVWLWLKHEDGEDSRWELTSVASKEGGIASYIPGESRFFSIESRENCVATFASGIKRPVFVDNIRTWQRELNGQTYKVYALDELEPRHCNAILSVPLIFPKQTNPPLQKGGLAFSNIRNLSGLICSHFDVSKSPSDLHDEESCTLMARSVTAAIISSFGETLLDVLVKMDALASEYLPREGSVVENRKNYLDEVIKLIRHRLQVDCVSVFYKTLLNEDSIECIASTGLYPQGGHEKLPDSCLSTIQYPKGEHQTGKTYATGVPFISKIGATHVRPDGITCISSEYPGEAKLKEYDHSWVCYPISIITVDSDKRISRKPVGVLRCVGNKSMLARNRERNFDPVQLQTIDFITNQLAPVLETMSNHIKRERYVTIIKHDLYNPLRLLDAGVEAITNQVDERLLPRHWDDKMQFSLAMARNLAGWLSEKESFHKTSISIVGEILTPLMSGLRYYAQIENNMTVRFDDNIRQFPRLYVDRELVERAFLNIVVNAIKYGTSRSEILITGEQNSSECRLHISNEGFGVDEADKEQIFVGEYRSTKAKSLKQGLGLGLKIARAAMERNGGKLELTRLSNPTTFTLVFSRQQ